MQVAGIIVTVIFRILYAECISQGEEVMWYGLQVVLSCATSWVAYVATGPIQDATHNLRFPTVVCLVFMILPVGLEMVRLISPVFIRDNAGSLGQGKEQEASSDDELFPVSKGAHTA
jgi:hypothetical protein